MILDLDEDEDDGKVEMTRIKLIGARFGPATILVPTQKLLGVTILEYMDLYWIFQPQDRADSFQMPEFKLTKGFLKVPNSTQQEQ